MPKLTILSDDELKELYQIPRFNDEEREVFFELTEDDHKYLDALDGVPEKVNYILQLGYFRALQYFFTLKFSELQGDVTFIIERYFSCKKAPKKNPSKWVHYKNQDRIKKTYGFKTPNQKFLLQLHRHAKNIAKTDVRAQYIFDQLLDLCQKQRIVRPAYSKLQSRPGTKDRVVLGHFESH